MSDISRPNILLITTDQQRYDTLGATGNTRIKTPHMDQLAERGVLFKQAYIQNPVCMGSRACMMTGRYPHQHGVTYMDSIIDESPGLPSWELTFMEHLQMAGYRTGATGKPHMMPQKGFNFERLSGGKGFRWTESEGLPIGPGPLGPDYASWLEARHPGGYEMIYEQRRKSEYWPNHTAMPSVLPLEEYSDYWITEQSIEFLNYPGPKPFFLWFSLLNPHAPLDPPSPYDELYPLKDIILPKSRSDNPHLSPKGWPEPWWGDDELRIRRWLSYYYGLVTLADDMIGRVIKVLEERGILDDMLIIMTSDHGDMAGDYNMMEKGNFYEEVTHVPLIIKPPGGRVADNTIDGLVEVSDIAPTILDYAGVPIPSEMQTISLKPLIEGDGKPHEYVFCEFISADRKRKGSCVRTDRYKYIHWENEELCEFYDLQQDPDEQINLYGKSEYLNNIDRHKSLLLDHYLRSQNHYYRDDTPTARELKTWM